MISHGSIMRTHLGKYLEISFTLRSLGQFLRPGSKLEEGGTCEPGCDDGLYVRLPSWLRDTFCHALSLCFALSLVCIVNFQRKTEQPKPSFLSVFSWQLSIIAFILETLCTKLLPVIDQNAAHASLSRQCMLFQFDHTTLLSIYLSFIPRVFCASSVAELAFPPTSPAVSMVLS